MILSLFAFLFAFTSLVACSPDLVKAAKDGDLNDVKDLLLFEENINFQDPFNKNNTALMFACLGNHMEMVKALLQASSINVNLQNYDGDSALTLALRNASSSTETIVHDLLSKGAKISIQSKDGSTPFIIAAQKQNYQLLEILISNGFDDRVDASGRSAADYVHEDEYLSRLLLFAGYKFNEYNVGNRWNWTHLMTLSALGNVSAVKEFLERERSSSRALCGKKNYWNESALFIAIKKGNEQLADFLGPLSYQSSKKKGDGDYSFYVRLMKCFAAAFLLLFVIILVFAGNRAKKQDQKKYNVNLEEKKTSSKV